MLDPLRTAAVDSLRNVVARSKRVSVVAFHSSFVCGINEFDTPPLAHLVQGGRGGEVRLKLFLCLTLIATRAPHSINDPYTPKYWSRLLALDPVKGPRRVSVGLKWLNDNNYIRS